MENPEEVLQALDEFQKLRPTEIPRELEDYLCWVAKTGDPVYQWSLVKALFREKLRRVMTDFYESCPSLELTPCPNVENFNYDRMKSNLLERLESFVNAPFTVQRICELLVAPRKEYNRVDKFMRAIEKNILVVSTREPGPTARPSENGDGMLNGFVEEDEPQPSTSTWMNDCESTTSRINSMHNGADNEAPPLETVLPSTSRQPTAQTSVLKNTSENEETPGEKPNQEPSASRTDLTVPNFVASNSEFTDVTNLTSQLQDSTEASSMQSIPATTSETSGIVGDVPEAIINEDTSSQPSLDLESEETESTDTKKLQTTFQAKDFASTDAHSPKFYERSESEAKLCQFTEGDAGRTTSDGETIKCNLESKLPYESNDSIGPTIENLLQTPNGKLEERTRKSDNEIEDAEINVGRKSLHSERTEKLLIESSSSDDTCSLSSSNDSESSARSYGTHMDVPGEPSNSSNSGYGENINSQSDEIKGDAKESTTNASEDVSTDSKENVPDVELNASEIPKPIVEEPPSEDIPTKECLPSSCPEKDNFTIVETVEDDAKVTKTLVPAPIPIVEEPKEPEPTVREAENSKSELCDISVNEDLPVACQLASEQKQTITEDHVGSENRTTEAAIPLEESGPLTAVDTPNKGECQSMESMEVDNEESSSTFQQDEPMEQETSELSKS